MEDDHPLDDSYLKLERAKELLEQLRTEYHDSRYKFAVKFWRGFSRETGAQLVWIEDVPAYPRKWGLIVGDIGNNLRSALDYLVFQLAEDPEKDRTAFPISETEADYLRPRGRKKLNYRDVCLAGVEPVWAEKIDSFQRFNLPPEHRPGPLSFLNWLTNRDKHRVRHPIYSKIETPFGFVTVEGSQYVKKLELRFSPPDILEVGGLITAPKSKKKGDKTILGLDPKRPDDRFGHEIVFGERRLSLMQLFGLVVFVEHVLKEFEPAFIPATGPN
jgi:hypothetical protein